MFLNSNGELYDLIDYFDAGFGNDDGWQASLNWANQAPLRSSRGGAASISGQPRSRSNAVTGSQLQRRWQRAFDTLDPDGLVTAIAGDGHCSAVIKVTGDLGDLLMGHATWDSYTAMTRIFKVRGESMTGWVRATLVGCVPLAVCMLAATTQAQPWHPVAPARCTSWQHYELGFEVPSGEWNPSCSREVGKPCIGAFC
jgi:hypothetical protein